MDLHGQSVRKLPSCSHPRPHEAAGARLVFITEDPALVRAIAIAAVERSPRARVSASVQAACRMYKKDVKIKGTNRRSPLESTEVSKNKLKNAPNAAQKTTHKWVKEAKQSEEQSQKGSISAHFSHLAGVI